MDSPRPFVAAGAAAMGVDGNTVVVSAWAGSSLVTSSTTSAAAAAAPLSSLSSMVSPSPFCNERRTGWLASTSRTSRALASYQHTRLFLPYRFQVGGKPLLTAAAVFEPEQTTHRPQTQTNPPKRTPAVTVLCRPLSLTLTLLVVLCHRTAKANWFLSRPGASGAAGRRPQQAFL